MICYGCDCDEWGIPEVIASRRLRCCRLICRHTKKKLLVAMLRLLKDVVFADGAADAGDVADVTVTVAGDTVEIVAPAGNMVVLGQMWMFVVFLGDSSGGHGVILNMGQNNLKAAAVAVAGVVVVVVVVAAAAVTELDVRFRFLDCNTSL